MITANIDFETADRITIANLAEICKTLIGEVNRIKALPGYPKSLPPHERTNLIDSRRQKKAVKTTLRYLMVESDFQRLLSELGKQECNGSCSCN
jgi:hypothetical protein